MNRKSTVKNDARAALLVLCFAAGLVLSVVGWIARYGDEVIQDLSPPMWQIWQAFDAADRITAIGAGDSHTGLGLFAMPIRGSVMNLGYAGESIPDTAQKLDIVLDRLPRVGIVLLQYQPHMFYAHRLGGAGDSAVGRILRKDEFWHPFADLLPQFHRCCRAAVPKWAAQRLIGKRPIPDPMVLENGYLIYRHNRVKPIPELARLEIESYGGTVMQPDLMSAYERLVGRLVHRGIRVILTRYPLTGAYRRMLGAAAFEAAERFEATLHQRFPGTERCGRWNWSDAEDLFLNSDHLNPEGAQRYWLVLKECLQRRVPQMISRGT